MQTLYTASSHAKPCKESIATASALYIMIAHFTAFKCATWAACLYRSSLPSCVSVFVCAYIVLVVCMQALDLLRAVGVVLIN